MLKTQQIFKNRNLCGYCREVLSHLHRLIKIEAIFFNHHKILYFHILRHPLRNGISNYEYKKSFFNINNNSMNRQFKRIISPGGLIIITVSQYVYVPGFLKIRDVDILMYIIRLYVQDLIDLNTILQKHSVKRYPGSSKSHSL